MTETNEERVGLLEETDLAYLQPPTDAKSQEEIDKISDTPLWPLNIREFTSIIFNLLKAGVPSSFAFVAVLLRGLFSLAFVGKYATSKELAGASLATSLGNMVVMTLGFTLNGGFLVNASQLNGAGKLAELKVIVQRQICLISVAIIPILVVLCFSDYILIWLNVDPEISRLTAEYFRMTFVAWVATLYGDFLKAFLMSQHIYTILGITHGILLVMHVPLLLLFVFTFDMPFVGAAVVKSITDLLVPVILLIYVFWRSELRHLIVSWSRQCLNNWWPHFKQMLVLGFDLFVDTVLLEFSILIVIYINDEYVISAHSIAMTLCALLFVIPFGNSMAMQTKVGAAVGENLKHKAQKLMAAGLFLNLLVCCFITVVSLVWNAEIANLMTNVPETVAIIRQFLYIYTIVFLGDSYKDHLAGILKAIGKEKDVIKIYLCCNVAIGFISQWILALPVHLGYPGVWIGLAVAMYFTCATLIARLVTTNWDKEIEVIQERLKHLEKFDEAQGL